MLILIYTQYIYIYIIYNFSYVIYTVWNKETIFLDELRILMLHKSSRISWACPFEDASSEYGEDEFEEEEPARAAQPAAPAAVSPAVTKATPAPAPVPKPARMICSLSAESWDILT